MGILKKEIISHFLVTILWLAAATVFRWQTVSQISGFLLFYLGGLLGTFLLDIDNFFYIVAYPQDQISLETRHLISNHQFKKALVYLVNTHEQRFKLAFHNILFQIFFYILCFWVLTSTSSEVGKGLVMAGALHLLKDEVHLLIGGWADQLRQGFFWPIKAEITFFQQRLFVATMVLLFLALNLLLV